MACVEETHPTKITLLKERNLCVFVVKRRLGTMTYLKFRFLERKKRLFKRSSSSVHIYMHHTATGRCVYTFWWYICALRGTFFYSHVYSVLCVCFLCPCCVYYVWGNIYIAKYISVFTMLVFPCEKLRSTAMFSPDRKFSKRAFWQLRLEHIWLTPPRHWFFSGRKMEISPFFAA